MSVFHVGDLLEVEIEKLSYGAAGIARKDGFVIFVPLSAPGDLLQVKITATKPRHAEASIEKIIRASALRRQAPCPVFGRCGGCDWQHLSYETQLEQKQSIVADFLKRAWPAEFQLLPIQPSPTEFRYRNRAQLKYDSGKLGFYARASHEIVDISDCPLIEAPLAERIPIIKKDLIAKNSPAVDKIEIQILQDGRLSTTMGDDPYAADGFSQVNRLQNENMKQCLLSWLAQEKFEVAFDLYAGAGNFTFAMMDQFRKAKLVAVEANPASVKRAQAFLLAGNISPKRCEFFTSAVEIFLRRSALPEGATVVLDPPRVGCDPFTIRSLAASGAQSLFYISCDPANLARDLKLLFSEGDRMGRKWRLVRAQCFDMFPQTHHVETLAHITRA